MFESSATAGAFRWLVQTLSRGPGGVCDYAVVTTDKRSLRNLLTVSNRELGPPGLNPLRSR